MHKAYDGTTAATVTLSEDRVSGDVLTTSYANASFVDANAGAGKLVNVIGIWVAGTGAANYTFDGTATPTAAITRRPITLTADPRSKVFGAVDPALTWQLTSGNLVGPDQVAGVGSQRRRHPGG